MLRQKIPFYEQVPLYASEVKRIKKKTKSTVPSMKISSPKLLHQFSPVGRMIRRNSHHGTYASARGSAVRDPIKNDVEKNASETVLPAVDKGPIRASADKLSKPQRQFSSPVVVKDPAGTIPGATASKKSHFFQEAVQNTTEWVIEDSKSETVLFCKCGKICKESFSLCDECISAGKLYEAGGYLYLKRDQNNLDRYWFQLINKELYCNTLYNN